MLKFLKAIAAAVGIYAIAMCATASAAVVALPSVHVGDAVTDAATTKSLYVAHAHFGRWPDCPAGIQITVDSFDDGPFGAVAHAEQPGCRIRVSILVYPVWAYGSPAAWCRVIEHEYGHLIGLGHSPDPRSVMYPYVDGRYSSPECIAGFPAKRHHHRRRGGAR